MNDAISRASLARRFLRAALIAASIAGMSACGGGGGGNDNPNVSIQADPQVKVSGSFTTGGMVPGVDITGRMTGDIAAMKNRTIYLQMQGGSGVYDPVPTLLYVLDDGSFSLRVNSVAAVTTPGHYQGQLSVKACFDLGCSQPISGTPVVVPYDFTISQALAVPNTPVSVTTPFGVTASAVDIPILLPDNVVRLEVDANPYTGPSDAPTCPVATGVIGTQPNTGSVHLAFPARSVGFCNTMIWVFAWTRQSDGSTLSSNGQSFLVTYTVTDNPAVDVWIDTPQPRATVHVGGVNVVDSGQYRLYAASGLTLTYAGTDYLDAPATAAGNADLNAWLQTPPNFGYGRTFMPCAYASDCLPEGVYTAQDRFTYQKNGQTIAYVVPIEMDVTP
jgi:hypothetical protein